MFNDTDDENTNITTTPASTTISPVSTTQHSPVFSPEMLEKIAMGMESDGYFDIDCVKCQLPFPRDKRSTNITDDDRVARGYRVSVSNDGKSKLWAIGAVIGSLVAVAVFIAVTYWFM
ncbi:hypothetical protein DPMN_133616 [Dreissena polymorpha]|uniref:Uncharacterized protein n=1 Tax=Dreissena polymorpha TaxID=45954 RepID=A0A9D4FY82_DREPO|nr:hypothetical protein DPMN_133616 [Dreissena polymorpha]